MPCQAGARLAALWHGVVPALVAVLVKCMEVWSWGPWQPVPQMLRGSSVVRGCHARQLPPGMPTASQAMQLRLLHPAPLLLPAMKYSTEQYSTWA
jgi:hypothetical protein